MVTDLAVEHILVGLEILVGAVAQYGFVPLAIILVLSAPLVLAVKVDRLLVLSLAFEIKIVGDDLADLQLLLIFLEGRLVELINAISQKPSFVRKRLLGGLHLRVREIV